MPFFKNVFKSRDGARAGTKGGKLGDEPVAQPKPRWEEAWSRSSVSPEEIQELVHVCTQEMKSRALDIPLLLLPFRPVSDPSAARNFIRNFFRASYDGTLQFSGDALLQELRLVEPLTLCSIIKWCWSRLPGGVVTWDAYELFRIGESDSNLARHAFDTFIPLSVDSDARKRIIFDFFDLIAATAARAKSNGMGGRKLSRMAGWWAFEITDNGKGFDGGYRTWSRAADAASHLFFAYLRSLAPESNTIGGMSALPRSLQALLSQTEYPPQAPLLMQTFTTKVVMIVDSVSPTPFALLRRAKNFEYRDDDAALQAFSSFEDPVSALTDECRRVLGSISSTNQSVQTSEASSEVPSWSRFEDLGFTGLADHASTTNGKSSAGGTREFSGLRNVARSQETDLGRPTTPSWADFLSAGFADENNQSAPTTLLPPSVKLPPIGEVSRIHSSQSHVRNGLQADEDLEPGELASISRFDLDETFWWVWITSLASEETVERKAAFGRCTLIETKISGAKWLVVEEQVKGATTGPEEGAYIAEKKSMFSWTKRGRLTRRKSTGKKPSGLSQPYSQSAANLPLSRTNIGPDQQARVQAAAAKLAKDQQDEREATQLAQRRARKDDAVSTKTNSVLTLQPHLLSEAGPAMKWDKRFGEAALDRDALRAQYLGDISAGKGGSGNDLFDIANGTKPSVPPKELSRELPALPIESDAQQRYVLAPPSPAPLPVSPKPEVLSAFAAEAPAAAQIPLPEASPLPPTALDEKPGPQEAYFDQHPALRKPVPERKAVAPVQPDTHRQARDDATAPSASKKPSPKKLLKKEGGLRKLFGKKKASPSTTAQAEEAEFDRRVEAADAAHDVPRLGDSRTAGREPSPAVSAERPYPVRSVSPDVSPSPAVSAISATHREPALQVVPDAGVYDSQAPAQPVSQFNQGPMEEMPAFVPDDDAEDSDDAAVAPTIPRYAPPTVPAHDPVSPVEDTARAQPDDASEDSVEVGPQAVPTQDRWAQIRKNAAERAARLSEEQSRRSQSQSARTDEGETSGEETIESRVARIKARVAELTGNMDQHSANGTAVR